MRVSKRSCSVLNPQNIDTSRSKRQRTKSPERLLLASYQPPANLSQDVDDVQLVSRDAFPHVELCNNDISLCGILLSDGMRPSRKGLVSILRVKRRAADCVLAASAVQPAMSCDSSITSLISEMSVEECPRVRFAPSVVTCVKEIPSCLSMTTEEKQRLYRGNRALQVESHNSKLERAFENSRYSLENVFEEDMYFRTHLGELLHPVHFRYYALKVLPRVVRDMYPHWVGFCPRETYWVAFMEYYALYKVCVQEKHFHPDLAQKYSEKLAAKRQGHVARS